MSTYFNKKNKCLCVALTFLIATSVVLILAGAQEGIEITFSQNPIGPVSYGEKIDFWWNITKPANYLAGEVYCLEISGPNYREIIWRGPIPRNGNFGSRTSWVVPPDALEGDYKAALKLPCDSPIHISSNIFPVNETLLIIRKFNDSNRNYEKDETDERLSSGWNFRVTYPDGSIKRHTTDVNGEIRIGGIPGHYRVEEIPDKPDWELVPPVQKEENVPRGETRTLDFLNIYRNTTLLIQKYQDTNRNGAIDNQDERLQGWTFIVTGPNGNRTYYSTDDGEIVINIEEGKEGDYIIEEIHESGWELIEKDTNVPVLDEGENWIKIIVEEGEESLVKFLNSPGVLIISKYYDHNMNGILDDGEEGLENWELVVKFPDGSIKTVTTGPDGKYTLHNPPIGPYEITEYLKDLCWKNSTPTMRKVEKRAGEGARVEFGNYEWGTLVIYKFNDTNHNGNWDEGELPVSNWGFRVKGADGFIDLTRYSDEKGSITVELPANIWFNVTDTFLVGWRNSTPLMQSVYINPCEETKLNFGNYNYSEINIRKFKDTNKDGIREDDEEWLAGWDFWITGPGVNETITTNEKGKAIYRDAIPGKYRIEELVGEERRAEGWRNTTLRIREEVNVTEGQKVELDFGNYIYCPCEDIYMPSELAPRWHNNSDENLVVSKYVDPRIVHCDNPNPNEGEIINVTLRVSAFAGMPPTDLVIAVDTSGSLLECSRAVLEAISEGITEYIANNEAKFGENVRIGLVSWDEDIDEIVNLTTDYSNVTAACKKLSINAEEDTLYPVGLNGSIGVFDRSPRENVTKMIVFITDARGTTDGLSNYSRLPDTSGYIIHAITVCTERDSDNFKMLENFTSQHSGFVRRVSESSDELAKELTTLTVSSIERRILNNVTVIETLPKYLRVLNWTYRIPPTSPDHINRDGIDWSTETIVWDIGELSSDKCWENTFQAIFCCRMPADESHPIGIPKKTSEVRYTDPTNSSITRHLPIPEGGIWIQPRPWWERVPVGLWALLGAMAIAIIALAIYCFRRTPKQET